jgi:RimJ/RimL family protein N-acetyltransferase
VGVIGPRESEKIVGSACYFLSPTTNLAETAFMVAPEMQGLGLGSALQERLQEYAVSRRVRGFVVETLPQNQRMQRLATRASGTVTTVRDQDTVHVTILFSGGDSGDDSAESAAAPLVTIPFARSATAGSRSMKRRDPP